MMFNNFSHKDNTLLNFKSIAHGVLGFWGTW